MAPLAHSAFSASGAKRGLSCPASFHLAQVHDDGQRRSSPFAAEGTLAHAISEACLLTGKDPSDFVGQTRNADGYQIAVDDEFAEALEPYVNLLRGLKAMGFIVLLEQRVSPQIHWGALPALPIDLFGTSDCIAYHPTLEVLVIADLKFGKGIVVETPDNPQLLYYAAGSISDELLKNMLLASGHAVPAGPVPIKEVRTTIVQPRAYHPEGPVRSHSYVPSKIIGWAQHDLYNGVKRALEDKGQTTNAGDWCRFCPAFVPCEAPKKLSLDTAKDMFAGAALENIPATGDTTIMQAPVLSFSDDALGELLDKISIIKPWMAAAEALAKERREAGRDVKGWALVPTLPRRKWADTDPDELRKTLDGITTLDPSDYISETILSPAQVQKRVGKKRYDQEVAPHVVKNSAGRSLVPNGDPRARVRSRSAHEAFNLPAINNPLKD